MIAVDRKGKSARKRSEVDKVSGNNLEIHEFLRSSYGQ